MPKYLVEITEVVSYIEHATINDIEVLAADDYDARDKLLEEAENGDYEMDYGDMDYQDSDIADIDTTFIGGAVKIVFPHIAVNEKECDDRYPIKERMEFIAEYGTVKEYKNYGAENQSVVEGSAWSTIDHRGRKVNGKFNEEEPENLAALLSILLNSEKCVVDVGDYYIEEIDDTVKPKEENIAGTLFDLR